MRLHSAPWIVDSTGERVNGYDFKGGQRVFIDPNHAGQIYITTMGGGVWHGPAAGSNGLNKTILTPVPVPHNHSD